ncbi:uncharacterized protein DUF4386 [Lacibacter cauensis]|uniref:Uncharacterized protein DUF4386 n=1 Tax=Lacibacter cauensis TaxID=510947 RepID=A0A562SWT7_9BACT|nr:DUF4386 domain-containing protein [Lacibacter cauensis]TWI85755.1 uncharacterized protein DUF4386 [Lacibacter cauensis]
MNIVYSAKSNNRSNAKMTGIFFIAAAVFSIAGLKLYDPVLTSKDFLHTGFINYYKVLSGAICELILAISAIGTGIMLYPYLKQYNESLGIGYLSFRVMEVVFIVTGTISILTVLSICHAYGTGVIPDRMYAHTIGSVFIDLHDWTFILGPNFMLAINTFIYSYVFLKTELVPKPLASFGIFASCLIMLAAIGELFGLFQQISIWGILLALPIAAYEISLAIRLIIKGFTLKEHKDQVTGYLNH